MSKMDLAGSAIADYLNEAGTSMARREMHLVGTGAVAELEAKLSAYYGAKYALCVSNASMGLLACGLALGLRNDEFLVPAYTYGASLSGWLLLGNRPRFVDIDPKTMTLDPAAAKRAITKKTRAILAVDVYGNPADDGALRQLADDRGLWYVADAAQSLGARLDGRPASAAAHLAVVSFTVGKSIYAGEGGAVITNDADLYRRLVWYTQHPARQRRDLGLGQTNELAINGRIHPLAAVWANATFEQSLVHLEQRQRVGVKLAERLNDSGVVEPRALDWMNFRPSFFKFTASLRGSNKLRDLQEAMQHEQSRVRVSPAPIMPIYRQPAFVGRYRSAKTPDCPVTETAFRRCVELTLEGLDERANQPTVARRKTAQLRPEHADGALVGMLKE